MIIMSDYEKASRAAFHIEFPLEEGNGCFFTSDLVYTSIFKEINVFHQYSTDFEFCLMIKHLVTLGFLPPEDVVHICMIN